ncbi:dihydroneopterin aldolase [Ferruginibacter sp.]
MFTIHLNNLRFFAFHGLYQEEKILGNEYEVNAEVTLVTHEAVTELHQTINYVKIYDIIKQRMQTPTALLETVAQELTDDIYSSDKRITSIYINIKKVYPPIAAFRGSVGVSYKKDF